MFTDCMVHFLLRHSVHRYKHTPLKTKPRRGNVVIKPPLANAGGLRDGAVHLLSVRSFVSLSPAKYAKSFARWQHLAASGGLIVSTPIHVFYVIYVVYLDYDFYRENSGENIVEILQHLHRHNNNGRQLSKDFSKYTV